MAIFRHRCRSLALALLAGAVACQPAREPIQQQPAKAVDRNSKKQCLGIVNGQTTTDFPSVVLVLALQQGRVSGTCTGTFIGPKTLLTAAHCITSPVMGFSRANQFDSTSQASEEQILSTFVQAAKVLNNDPNINSRPAVDDDAASDIAILIFSQQVATALSGIISSTPVVDDAATLVGFGRTTTDFSTPEPQIFKRFGRNAVAQVDAVKVSLLGRAVTASTGVAATDSLGAQGDSGGPLLIGGKVAGVLAIDGIVDSGESHNVYGNLTHPDMIAFLKEAIAAGADFEMPVEGEDGDSDPATDGLDGETDDSGESDDPDCEE